MRKELHIIYLRPDLSFTSALKPIYVEPNCLASLASCSMTPVEISKKVSFEFWYFHAFALWLIHNIYWAPVSFFKDKREDGAILWISSWFLLFVLIQTLLGLIQWTSATGTTPSSTRGRECFNFQRSCFFVHHGAVLELQNHLSKAVYLCELGYSTLFY